MQPAWVRGQGPCHSGSKEQQPTFTEKTECRLCEESFPWETLRESFHFILSSTGGPGNRIIMPILQIRKQRGQVQFFKVHIVGKGDLTLSGLKPRPMGLAITVYCLLDKA